MIQAIPNWKSAWKMASMWVATAAVVFGALPVETQTAILEAMHVPPHRIPLYLGLALYGSRLIKQPNL